MLYKKDINAWTWFSKGYSRDNVFLYFSSDSGF